ncbi:hypothetical protein C8Q72DRAFT_383335 [Fomitopsis betulina]|nr:hypothetical protein C8Q72DRAFT_383335 [Fomitopsis betulina]
MQHTMGRAVQSLRLPVGSLFNWKLTPPGSSLTFNGADFTAVQYLDWLLYNDTSSPHDPLYDVSSLEWFVEKDFILSPGLLGPDQDSWFEINEMSPWLSSEDSSTVTLNWTDSCLRCYVEVDWPIPSHASTVAPLMSITQVPESTIASATFPSATQFFAPATTARCFIGKEYVASATGSMALPTAVAVDTKNETPSPVQGASLPVATDPFASFVSIDGILGPKPEAEFGFVFRILEAVREHFNIPQHKFYPIIVLPIPALFVWLLDSRFANEADENEHEEEEDIKGEYLERDSKQELNSDNKLRLAVSADFEWDDSPSVIVVLRAEAGLGSFPSF